MEEEPDPREHGEAQSSGRAVPAEGCSCAGSTPKDAGLEHEEETINIGNLSGGRVEWIEPRTAGGDGEGA